MTRAGISFYSVLISIALCIASHQASSQDKSSLSISQLNLHEKVYLHSDKNFYLAGEIVWFKLYCVDAADYQSLDVSKVAYVELIDRNNKPVLQAKIALTDGSGNGSLYLPLTINSDHYVLRTYTNLMKNGGNEVFFEKTISVANTTKSSALNFSNDFSKADAVFFPESGHLVEGLQTKIAFRITGNDGRGVDARGILVDNNGDTLLQFSPSRFGIGYFNFTPAADKKYKAVILLPQGKFIERALPVADKYGYVMNVTGDEAAQFRVRVRATTNRAEATSEQLMLLVHNHQSVKFSQQQNTDYKNDLFFNVDKSKLGEGVNLLTLFNKDGQPVCERLVFIRPSSLPKAEISSDKAVYANRQSVDLSVSISGTAPGEPADCSVSVFQLDSLQRADDIDIASYISLVSDLKGTIESPAYYLSNDAGADEATDNLMLTHGWRKFKWETAQGDKLQVPVKFVPEFMGHTISARVMNVTTGATVGGADCFLTVPSSPPGTYMSRSDSLGIVKFEVRNYYGPGDIIGQVAETNKANYRLDFFSPFSDDPALTGLPDFYLPGKNEERLQKKNIAMQAQNIYLADSVRRFVPPFLPDTLPFFGKAEYRYALDDYKRFTTMEEVLREYVMPVNVLLRNGKLSMSMFDDAIREVYHDNILVMLDGVPLTDYNKIFSYDPLKVKRLDVVPRRFLFGYRFVSGIVSFETYDGRFDAFDIDPSLIAVDYEGLQLQREFYSPRYEAGTARNRLPDLRTTLYWAPSVVSDKSGKANLQFYTSDQKGKFIVVLQGMSKTGKPVVGTTSFEVK